VARIDEDKMTYVIDDHNQALSLIIIDVSSPSLRSKVGLAMELIVA
jgi:hypothetical protein